MRIFDRLDALFAIRLGGLSRALVLVAALALVPTYLTPLWNLTMFAPQYQEGLRLDIYSYKLQGGNKGQDIEEINVLNHYIGMRDLVAEDFTEFKWMPFVIGGLALIMLRAAVFGRMKNLLDVVAVFLYFGAFSLFSFAYKLYSYGHDLSPHAAVKVAPFMPPVFGRAQMANFEIYSYPSVASYAIFASLVVLSLAGVIAYRARRAG